MKMPRTRQNEEEKMFQGKSEQLTAEPDETSHKINGAPGNTFSLAHLAEAMHPHWAMELPQAIHPCQAKHPCKIIHPCKAIHSCTLRPYIHDRCYTSQAIHPWQVLHPSGHTSVTGATPMSESYTRDRRYTHVKRHTYHTIHLSWAKHTRQAQYTNLWQNIHIKRCTLGGYAKGQAIIPRAPVLKGLRLADQASTLWASLDILCPLSCQAFDPQFRKNHILKFYFPKPFR